MSESSKYAIAQINIPIEIFPNGEWTNHNDRVSIHIAPASELPPISEIDSEQLQSTIQEILGVNETTSVKIPIYFSEESELPFMVKAKPILDETPEEPIQHPCSSPPPMEKVEYIDREELLARPRRQPSKNTSFKHTPYKSHNKTKHNRWSSR